MVGGKVVRSAATTFASSKMVIFVDSITNNKRSKVDRSRTVTTGNIQLVTVVFKVRLASYTSIIGSVHM